MIQFINKILLVYLKHSLTLQSKTGTKTSNLMATICSVWTIQVIQNEMVLVSFTKTLGVQIIKSLSFCKCIICKVSIQNSKGYIGIAYRSQRQDVFEFENFPSYFEVLSDTTFCNSLFTTILGHFNASNLNPLQLCMGFIN